MEREKRGKGRERKARANLGEKKKEKRERSAKSEVELKLYILNRRGGLRPEGGRFFTLRRLVDAPMLKKKWEKNEGKTKRQKKPIRIKKPYGGGGDENSKNRLG